MRALVEADPSHAEERDEAQEGGFTPIHTAAFNGDAGMVDDLLARGADPTTTTDDGKTAADFAAEKGHDALAARLRDH